MTQNHPFLKQEKKNSLKKLWLAHHEEERGEHVLSNLYIMLLIIKGLNKFLVPINILNFVLSS
jgi:hypothetical protein